MLDSDDSDRPQRRSALVARELSKLYVDIAALSEVRFAEEGSLMKHGAGYTLFWSGREKKGHRQSGVGFMTKNAIANRLHTLPTGHSDRILSLWLPIQADQFVTLVSVYSPTLQAGLAACCTRSFLQRATQPHHTHQPQGQTNHPWRLQCQSWQRLNCGRVSLEDMVMGTAMITDACYCSSVLNTS